VKPDQYHRVRIALDQVLSVFRAASVADLSPDDLALLRQLEVMRSRALRGESGHPFPLRSIDQGERPAEPGHRLGSLEPAGPDRPARAQSKKIRVLVVDDQVSVRTIMRALLAAEGDFDVVAEAANGQEAVELAEACRPDLVTMDLNMPVLDGVSATREVLRVSPDTKVVIYSASHDPISVRRATQAGAMGYLYKPASRQALISALRDVLRGNSVIQRASSFTQAPTG
jgi:CheY-like chemotaxis protein